MAREIQLRLNFSSEDAARLYTTVSTLFRRSNRGDIPCVLATLHFSTVAEEGRREGVGVIETERNRSFNPLALAENAASLHKPLRREKNREK